MEKQQDFTSSRNRGPSRAESPVSAANELVSAKGSPASGEPERDASLTQVAPGQWFWVKENRSGSEEPQWLGCVVHVGSNFVELHEPSIEGYGTNVIRIHADELHQYLTPEPDAVRVIREKIAYFQVQTRALFEQVQEVTKQLGLKSTRKQLGLESGESGSRALAVLSSQVDVRAYEKALVQAKDRTLPELFKEIKYTTAEVARWMQAEALPLEAKLKPLQSSLEEITDRIFHVRLYAGAAEEAVCCAKGSAAEMHEKLHIMQRRVYMDEECLLDYRAGGMEFKSLKAFDTWLAEPRNRNRILPFPRTLVAMQVRRTAKERDFDGSFLGAYIKMRLEEDDKLTFLYVRNGEQLWRISSELDFGELIFPDKTVFDPQEPKMARMFGHRPDQFMSVPEYEDRLKEWQELKAKGLQWKKENRGKSWIHNPFLGLSGEPSCSFNPKDWSRVDESNVYLDECLEEIAGQIKEYNRIALMIQGLFDRSEVLHPHPPVRSWDAASFAATIELVYDGSQVLHHGPPPDFLAYRAQCNESLNAQSFVTGQHDFWLRREAARYNQAARRSRYGSKHYDVKRYEPWDDSGPPIVGCPQEWRPRSKVAVFKWEKPTRVRGRYYESAGKLVPKSLTVPEAELFNVSAYRTGDYKQFFVDSRTRAQYLKWAPLLLTAEDYLAGKLPQGRKT